LLGEPVVEGKNRKLVHYSGQVQGVGFRYTTRRIASQFDVTGFVRNLPDGRVQLMVAGRESELLHFLQEIAATFAANITDTVVEDGPAGNDSSRFEIRSPGFEIRS
jgi:acylphosphatase